MSGTFAHGVMCDVRDVRQDQGPLIGAELRRFPPGEKSLGKGQPRRFGGS